MDSIWENLGEALLGILKLVGGLAGLFGLWLIGIMWKSYRKEASLSHARESLRGIRAGIHSFGGLSEDSRKSVTMLRGETCDSLRAMGAPSEVVSAVESGDWSFVAQALKNETALRRQAALEL